MLNKTAENQQLIELQTIYKRSPDITDKSHHRILHPKNQKKDMNDIRM